MQQIDEMADGNEIVQHFSCQLKRKTPSDGPAWCPGSTPTLCLVPCAVGIGFLVTQNRISDWKADAYMSIQCTMRASPGRLTGKRQHTIQ